MPKELIVITLLFLVQLTLKAQEKLGDRWVDNNLVFEVVDDEVKSKGIFEICIKDTAVGFCVQNLITGVEISVRDANNKEIWKGVGSGITKTLQLKEPMPQAAYLIIKAFKPWVTNRRTGNRIHQDKPLELKYKVK